MNPGRERLPSWIGAMSSLVRTSPDETTLVISIRGLSRCSERLTRLTGRVPSQLRHNTTLHLRLRQAHQLPPQKNTSDTAGDARGR
jgi:hypothetical protein